MKVSIIINNFNYARYLSEAIDSALSQDYSGCEVIVVDDGSTDGSRQIIESYGDRVIPVFKANGGQASAFNAGWTKAGGDVILFLDADDRYSTNTISKIVQAWSPSLAMLVFRLNVIDSGSKPKGEIYPRVNAPLASGDCRERLAAGMNPMFPPTTGLAFNRRILEQILPMPEEEYRICADVYLTIKSALLGSVGALEEPLADYRIHGENAWVAPNRFTKESLDRSLKTRKLRVQLIEKGTGARSTRGNLRWLWHGSRFAAWRAAGYRLGCRTAAAETKVSLLGDAIYAFFGDGREPIKRRVQFFLLTLGMLGPSPIASKALAMLKRHREASAAYGNLSCS